MAIVNPVHGPLHGVKVVDFGRILAGPLAPMELAMFGATVIKVDSIKRPDGWHNVKPWFEDKPGLNRSGGFAVANMNKFGIVLNWDRPGGVDVAKRLIAWADVVSENFRPGVMEKVGLDYEVVRKVNPKTIMLSISMVGQTGPHRRAGGAAPQMHGLSGLTHLNGWPDRESIDPGIAFADANTGLFGAMAVSAALVHRARTGQGQHIDLSFYESSTFMLSRNLLDWTVNGRVGQRNGNALMAGPQPAVAPHGIYPCKGENGWCAIVAASDPEWARLRQVMGDPAWAGQPEFATNVARCQHAADLDAKLATWTVLQEARPLMERLQAAGVAAGVVNDLRALNEDPQLHHRGHFTKVRHGVIGEMVVEMPSVRLSATPPGIFKAAPCIGEDTEAIYRDVLGYSDEQIAALVESGVIEFA